MASAIKRTKKQRTPKTSNRIHGGGGKVRLTEIQKALMGKGMVGKPRKKIVETD